MTNGLLDFNKSRIFPKMVGDDASFFMATSFTKKNKIMTAIAPGIRDKRKTAWVSIVSKIANATRGPMMAPS
jgi:hypothetical protein